MADAIVILLSAYAQKIELSLFSALISGSHRLFGVDLLGETCVCFSGTCVCCIGDGIDWLYIHFHRRDKCLPSHEVFLGLAHRMIPGDALGIKV